MPEGGGKNFVALTKETSGPPRSRLLKPHEENFAENNTFNISSSQIFDAEPAQAIREQNFTQISRNLPAKRKINDERVKKRKFLKLTVRHICWRNSWRNVSQKIIQNFRRMKDNASDGRKTLT